MGFDTAKSWHFFHLRVINYIHMIREGASMKTYEAGNFHNAAILKIASLCVCVCVRTRAHVCVIVTIHLLQSLLVIIAGVDLRFMSESKLHVC